MKIIVVGCGRWGSFIAWYLNHIGHDVTLYGRESSKNMCELMATRKNSHIVLPDSIKLTNSLDEIKNAQSIIISINSQNLSTLMSEISKNDIQNKKFVLCMKGIEIATGRRLSQIVCDSVDSSNSVSVWLGPGHVEELFQGTPNCMVIGSDHEAVKEELVIEFSSDLIRFYYGDDLIGNEIGAAAKNVIGIAAGMLDGLNLSSLKGSLMSRGTREVGRLISAMGGKELSAYGLCHLGDYEATVFSKFSHNRMFGEMFVKGESFTQLAEGFYTVEALMVLKDKYEVELPICTAVYDVLYNGIEAKYALVKLFSRNNKKEFL
ncbi:MAG: NAD(P)H-dependent glycerol-3-phosphate dehydrogenase [Oscillospiraceae bacterium]